MVIVVIFSAARKALRRPLTLDARPDKGIDDVANGRRALTNGVSRPPSWRGSDPRGIDEGIVPTAGVCTGDPSAHRAESEERVSTCRMPAPGGLDFTAAEGLNIPGRVASVDAGCRLPHRAGVIHRWWTRWGRNPQRVE